MNTLGRITLLAILALTLPSCSERRAPTSPDPAFDRSGARRLAAPAAASTQTVGSYVVRFDGRAVAGGQTTFSYTVSGTGVDPALSYFAIQIPSCAPSLAASDPAGGVVGLDPNSGLQGIKWDLSLAPTASRSYSITFPGDVPLGLVRVAVKAGASVTLGVVPGPCQGFLISGTVFVDSDSNGVRDPVTEAGILAGVTVTLEDAAGNTETVVTDVNGRYRFLRLDGVYTVRIDATTPAADFNEELVESFAATGPTARSVTVGPNAEGIDFGFKPRARKVIADLKDGFLTTDGLPGSFWVKAFRAGARGASYGGFDPASLLGLLTRIEGSFFPQPYQFTDGNELQEALAILTNKSKDPVAVLYRELLAAELNDAAGRGITSDPELQDVLLTWGESLLIASGAVSGANASLPPLNSLSTDLSDATELFATMNNARGGGGIPDSF